LSGYFRSDFSRKQQGSIKVFGFFRVDFLRQNSKQTFAQTTATVALNMSKWSRSALFRRRSESFEFYIFSYHLLTNPSARYNPIVAPESTPTTTVQDGDGGSNTTYDAPAPSALPIH
jgi:hypothetical protein